MPRVRPASPPTGAGSTGEARGGPFPTSGSATPFSKEETIDSQSTAVLHEARGRIKSGKAAASFDHVAFLSHCGWELIQEGNRERPWVAKRIDGEGASYSSYLELKPLLVDVKSRKQANNRKGSRP